MALVARGKRLRDLRAHGLVLRNAESSEHLELAIEVLDAPARDARYDLVVVAVRCEQLSGTLPILAAKTHVRDVLFFGNTAGHARGLIEGLGDRALFGFPGGRRRPARCGGCRRSSPMPLGLPTRLTADIDGWLLGHAAFVVPIALPCTGPSDTDAARLARDTVTLRLMVRATAQAFRALRTAHVAEIPTNLAVLYLWMPGEFTVRYWQRILAGPRGELWFAGHARSAAQEMTLLRDGLLAAVQRTGRSAPELDTLLTPA